MATNGTDTSQPFAPVRTSEIKLRTERNDAARIDVVVRKVIVTFDVIKVHGLGDARQLVEIEQKTVEVWIINDAAEIAFEVDVIDRVEPDQRTEEPPICFHRFRAEQVTTRGQAMFQLIERREERTERFLVSLLPVRKARFVHAIVHVLVNELREFRMFRFKVAWK